MTRPSVLFLTHRVPHPPNRGDRIRTFHFLQHLAERCDVWLGCLADEPVSDESLRVLQRLCHRVAIVPVEGRKRWLRACGSWLTGRTISEGAFQAPRLLRIVQEWAGQESFDVALCSSSALAPYFQTQPFRDTKRFVDLIDVDSEKWFDYSQTTSFPKNRIFRTEAVRMRKQEAAMADWATGITVVSEPEANIYRAFRPDGPIQAIPNGVDINYFTPDIDRSRENGCVFVGALDYKPNADGIIWFARTIWPEIHRQRPDQVLRIVGREPGPAVRDLDGVSGVKVVGTVPDVRPWLNGAAVAVVPLQIARGVQNKVLEALAMARAVVASPAPLVGLHAEHGSQLFAAATPEAWVEQIVRLLDDQQLRHDIGVAGQAYVMANHRWDQCLAPLMEFLHLAEEPRQLTPSKARHAGGTP